MAVAAIVLALIWLQRPRLRSLVQVIPTLTPSPALPTVPTGTPRPDPTLTPTPLPTPTPVGGGGVVVFDMWRGGNRDLYLKSLAGGEPVRLTSHPAEDRAPAWSPDGTRIAFESQRDGNWELYLLDLPTGELRRLTNDPHYDGDPAWSPDGTRIAFASHRQGDLDVFVLDLRDGRISQLTEDPTPEYDPAWSPDGRYVAFVAWRNSLPTGNPDEPATDTDWNREIFLVTADGSTQPINLTRDPSDDYDPAWAPATNRLAFVSDRSGITRPYILELPPDIAVLEGALLLEELPAQPVQSSSGLISQPVWSPDGLALAYVVEGRAQWTLTLASVLPGGGVAHPFQASEAVGDPAWGSSLSMPVVETVGEVSHARWIEPEGIGLTPTPVFVENVDPTPEAGAPYRLKLLPGVTGGNPKLSDRVDDSFMALRARVKAETGRDLLATIGDGLRPVSYVGDGSSPMSWHKAGRAVDLSIDTNGRDGQPIMVIVREDRSGRTWWRLFLRAARQDGTQGEPLKVAPWSFYARFTDEAAAEAGGRRLAVPAGYWIDFTSLAAQHGWRRIPANDRPGLAWREDWNAIEYWHFENRGGLSWRQAMREVYDEATLDENF